MRALAVLALAVALAGCAAEREAVTVTVTTAEPEAPPQRCENVEDGFSVAYPGSWYQERCAFFHPDEFELPERTETLGVAITISREPVSFEAAAGDQPTRSDVEREELTVANQPAVRLESTSTGEGLLPDGTRVYEVLVDVGGATLIASTRGIGELDFEENKGVLDEMVESLRLLD